MTTTPLPTTPVSGWQQILSTVYTVIDASVQHSIIHATQHARTLACHVGCSNCCKHQIIPASIPEVLGIIHHIETELPAETTGSILSRALGEQTTTCPFLDADVCSIYNARPIACRRYLVATSPCLEAEDVWATRPHDQIIPSANALRHARKLLLNALGITSEVHMQRAEAANHLQNISVDIIRCDWNALFRQFSHKIRSPHG